MQRVRRVAVTALAAALATTGLSACDRQPGIAAYVGDVRITEERVDAIYDEARDRLSADALKAARAAAEAANRTPPVDAPPVKMPITREDVVTSLVGIEVLRQIVRERNLPVQPVQAEQVAEQIKLPADTEYVRAAAEYNGYLGAFAQTVQPAAITDADLRAVYDKLGAAGAPDRPGDSFEDFKNSVNPEDREVLAQRLGLRDAIAEAAGGSGNRINPRYGDAELPLLWGNDAQGESKPLVTLRFDAETREPAVVDLQ